MIYVTRIDEPDAVREALLKPFEKRENQTEIQLARAYYGVSPRPKKAFEFERYKEPQVCRALDDLFHEKCAYCESSYRAADARDVEHYRPKAGISECPDHPGYWWLAAVWSNLLPSCPSCNRRRRQCIFKPGMTEEEFLRASREIPKRTTGKGNSFPVRNDNWIDSEDGDLGAEDPLLINPLLRDPDDHVEWVFDWNRERFLWEAARVTAAVRPRLVDGEEDPYGKASIRIYGLNRAGLVRERMTQIKRIQLVCRGVVDTITDLHDATTAARKRTLEARLKRWRKDFESFTDPKEEQYVGMARAFLDEFDVELDRFTASLPR